ncbi:XRE family transcriptional regulator [Xanthomonas vasicola]|uniref:XRE family transcriptional regulator n=1 Tax=Xanthomonas vasicola TaxID=56459 RepID=UPI000531BF1A|nr:S24 family peptidase [Xanthomonas vasicola]KGR38546.1 cI repressor protein [Xanthomonas vasicola]RNK73257.1 helix-turn-helix transcriptional regulator [Xanthomonas vasicola pv. vasculorum]RNL00620.1 helix-turn-helix transcriptional regulator [Xanthomonas vasicola pv. vasculorum]TWQ40819.1 helix-turn-helix transcriptional regulator [Xanthomonas vasicola]TWQ61220.1 helix-turn-helix transcriptional regulator [Xanthomonas vasicola]
MGTTIGDRIREARKARGLSRPDLAKLSGIKYPTLAGIENNDQTGTTQLPELAEALGVNVRWLQSGMGPRDASEKAQPDERDWADITGYSQAVGLGAGGTEAVEYAETHSLKFKKTSLRRRGILNHPLAVYYGRGDSMEPTINDGDAILFDTSDTRPVDGSLYLIQVLGAANAEYYVKRAEILDGIVYFRSDNPTGDHHWRKPKRMDSNREPIVVIGRVHWIGGWAD